MPKKRMTAEQIIPKLRLGHPTTPQHIATNAKTPAHRCTGASLYLMPRSLGAACVCSPGATLCELGDLCLRPNC